MLDLIVISEARSAFIILEAKVMDEFTEFFCLLSVQKIQNLHKFLENSKGLQRVCFHKLALNKSWSAVRLCFIFPR